MEIARTPCLKGNERAFNANPFINMFKVIEFWMGVPQIVDSLRRTREFMPENWVDPREYEELIQAQHQEVDAFKTYSEIYHGTEFIENTKQAIPLFQDAVRAADHKGIEKFMLILGTYDDGFSKFKDSKVDQTVLCISLSKCF